MRLISSWIRLILFASIGVFLFILVLIPAAECETMDDCRGNFSYCLDDYCDCGHDSNDYRCYERDWYEAVYYPAYDSYRGHGNGISVLLLVTIVVGSTILVVQECNSAPNPTRRETNEITDHFSVPLIPSFQGASIIHRRSVPYIPYKHSEFYAAEMNILENTIGTHECVPMVFTHSE